MELMTSWEEKGLLKGLQEGRQEGRQEGLAEGKLQFALLILDHHFGSTMTEALKGRVQSLSSSELEELAGEMDQLHTPADLDKWLVARGK